MTFRERFDFVILVSVFSTFVAASVIRFFDYPLFLTQTSINTFSILSSQWLVRALENGYVSVELIRVSST